MSKFIEQYEKMKIKRNIIDTDIINILNLIRSYDIQMEKHCKDVGNLAYKICISMNLNEDFANYCAICGYIHDIGKVWISKDIISKKGKITKEERENYKKYIEKGYNYCLENPKLRKYSYFIKSFHTDLNEKDFNETIPLEAQIVKVANEFENIRRKHDLQDYVGISKALKIIIKNASSTTAKKDNGKIYIKNKKGKNNKEVVKALLYVMLDEVYVEITETKNYMDYLGINISRIKKIYKKKNTNQAIENTLSEQERFGDFQVILADYRNNYNLKEIYYKSLVRELKIIKKLKILP